MKDWATSTPPVTTENSSGSKNCGTALANHSEVCGDKSEGLAMTRLPAAKTPAKGAKIMNKGPFQVPAMPTTPLGWNRNSARAPNRLNGNKPARRCGCIHWSTCLMAYFKASMGAWMSNIMVLTGWRPPKSALMTSQMVSLFCLSNSTQRLRRSLRTEASTGPSAMNAMRWRVKCRAISSEEGAAFKALWFIF